jgi:AbrB family looped-hinge helix DNA binding protein
VEVAKVTSKGQITIPISIRRKLDINEGDKVLFVYKPDGVLMVNPNTYQGGASDLVEASKPEATEKTVSPAREKPAASAPQKAVAGPPEVETNEEVYIEAEVIYEEPKYEAKPTPTPPSPTIPSTGSKQVGGVDLSTLLDDIRSIGSNI